MPRKGKRSAAQKVRWQKFGSTDRDDNPVPSLAESLECLSSGVNYALLIMSSVCIAVFRDHQGRYGIFDPHSRRHDGLPHGPGGSGTAVMHIFTCLSELIAKIVKLFHMLGTGPLTQFELMPVLFHTVNEHVTPNDLAHGNSNVTDADFSRREVNPNLMAVTPQQINQRVKHFSKKSKQKKKKLKRFLLALDKEKASFAASIKRSEVRKMKKNMTEKEKYAQDPHVARQKKEKSTKHYNKNAECRERKVSKTKTRYQKDPVFRQWRKCYVNNQYRQDDAFREKKKSSVNDRYRQDDAFKEKKKSSVNDRYRQDDAFKEKKKSSVNDRYRQDDAFKEKKKSSVNDRYRQDDAFKENKISYMINRYRSNARSRQSKKTYITKRYANDPEFRLKHKDTMRQIMRNKSLSMRKPSNILCAMKIRRKYRCITRHTNPRDDSLIREAIKVFRAQISNGPTYVCTVCHRALFPNQVRPCNRSKYVKEPHVARTCLTGRYVHVCDNECQSSRQCTVPDERKREWICYTCHDHLIRGSMPSLAMANSLELSDIPPELRDLNILERHLISKCITFAKIIPLPKGQQRAIHGNVVCVPSEVQGTVNALPRLRSESQVMRVKLKRRLCYKGHQMFQTITWPKLVRALLTLKEIHPQYTDVIIREDAELCDPTLPDEGDDDTDEEKMDDGDYDEEDLMEIDSFENDALSNAENVTENDEQISQQQSDTMQQEGDEPNGGVVLESCLQPTDVSEEILSFSDNIYSVAPAEGNKPVSFFKTPKLEAMAFPVQFPTGKNTLDEDRRIKLTPCSYFKSRLFCADDRFARDSNYLFFGQFVTEIHLATSSMRIQLRKGKPFTRDGRRINNAMLQDKKEVERLVCNRDATRFMMPLRGTPAYWSKTTKELFAMFRQIGSPTFFCTFSAAEMRWKEVITIIKTQQGEQVNFDELDWSSKCDILRSNPVTTMRLFDKRVEALFRDVILSPAQPIGEVADYFWRLEFQHRGSPHIHSLIWVKGAPVFEEDSDQKVCEFVSKYITAELPDQNTQPELYKKVTEVQMHSRNHSKTCVKYLGANCRFGFPKQPTPNTMVLRPEGCNDPEKEAAATTKLTALKRLLNEPANCSLSFEQILARCELTVDEYKQCLHLTARSTEVILKRGPQDCWVNNYNPSLLEAWDANMDIQFILNPYSCVAYICSYISKAEHGLSEYLKTVLQNSSQENVNESDEMKQIMQAYSKKREVSAQECVARACGLHMKQCTRSVVFVQTDENALRMSYPMSFLENKTPDSDNIWMSGLPDKYKCRPETPEFEVMCLADFASTCRIVYGKQTKSKKAFPLLNEMGYVQKRSNEKHAIIRYCRFSQEKNPEEFHRTLLKLYLPHRSDDQLKSRNFPTNQSFHDFACVQLPGSEHPEPVRQIVNRNREKYEKHREEIENAIKEFEENGGMINEWCNLAPESEVERLECIDELQAREPGDENIQENVPDFNVRADTSSEIAITRETPSIDPTLLRQMYQNLNQKQACVFYSIRDWCLKRVCGLNPEQFFFYINGGAGTGKSHLIKCIHAEASKILNRLPRTAEEADISKPTVLLSAFTGTAAFNISGTTLHCLLKLPRSLKPPFQGLGNKLDEVRAELSNAEILIIDEVSMVSKPLFAYVDERLKQIKGTQKPFGGMSVLAVGDFYQLPPVRQCKPLCVYDPTQIDLWRDSFQMITLTEIMRQKDDVPFAEMLNRIRVKEKSEPLSLVDRSLLLHAVTDQANCPKDILHIYATNKQVDEHNSASLQLFHSEIITINADDYKKDPQTGRMEIRAVPFPGTKKELPDSIQVAIGARVMLTRNINVLSGLCNGTFAHVVEIVTKAGSPHVDKLGLQLDNRNAVNTHNIVYIDREEENLKQNGVVRRQFPIRLAFACTIHKVQGMSTSSAVVSLKHIFEPGMAYVALSRVTSLSGLHILDMDEEKIYANPEINVALAAMTEASLEHVMPLLHATKGLNRGVTLTVVHHNTEGLPCHIADIKSHHELYLADVLCLTETHLKGSFVSETLHLDGYNMFKRNRNVSYTNYPDMANKNGGGVAIYVKNHIRATERQYIQNATDIEFTVVKLEAPFPATIAVVYKPPGYSGLSFLSNLQSLLNALEIMDHHPILVCGDFNEDLLSRAFKPILELFHSRGYEQLINAATTDKNTLLDLIFISRPQCCLHSGVIQTYYSYHNPVYCVLTP
ncbi:uncharacterized protein LOC141802702 isoform X2 [Halichoeres trimaculatus]|uniref:uncharacterized protein LOC141802702 isoform X2 n=1 Tax=Halichoeres trimaculatus TaxID=147232 RepID=UPI003D9DCA50